MKTTKKHFEFFKRECLALAEGWGINDWDIRFILCDRDDAIASISRTVTGRIANIYLNSENSKKDLTEESLIETARHEMAHLLIGRLAEYAQARYVTPDEIEEAEEELVIKLIKILPRRA